VYCRIGVAQVLPVALALLPLAYLIRMCVLRYVDVPLWDAWEMVPRLDHLYAGSLTLRDLWGQHNEHRPMVAIALMLALARLTRWNTNWEIVVTVLLTTSIFAAFAAFVRRAWRSHGGAPLWLLPAISLLVFSPVQWENLMWGFPMHIIMCALATLLAADSVAFLGVRQRGLGRALVCAVWATYSFASGLLLWPVLAVGIAVVGGPRRRSRLVLWAAAAAITYATYFYDYHRPPQPSMLGNFASLHAIRIFGTYALTYLGSPIAGFDPRIAAAAGAVGLAAFAALAVRLRHLREDPAYLFPILVGLQTLVTALVSAMGRAWMGADQALASRYTTLSIPMWCALACLSVLWRSAAPADLRGRALTAVTVSLLVATLASAFATERDGVHIVAGRSETLRFARRGLITGRSDALLGLLYPNVPVLRERRATLMRLRLSVFRPSDRPTYPLPGEP